jgi:4,5:9,10-diseco-3-hydroxy-5,9,17-trioxoandrosta-1(10),2-diene-4-oate hydrolase
MKRFRRKLESSAVHTFRGDGIDRRAAWKIGLEAVGLERHYRDARQRLGAGDGARFVDVDGKRVAYFDVGSGPAIVCLHAIGHGGGDYAALASTLAPRHRVIAIDWPGHGLSDDDGVTPSGAHLARCVDVVLSRLDVGPAVVIGSSLGGAAALCFAATKPERVAGLVLENPAGLAPVDAPARVVSRMMAMFFRGGARGASWFRGAYERYYRGVLPFARDRRDQIVAAGPAMAGKLAAAWSSFAEPSADLRASADAIHAPTLVAWARRDRFVTLARNRKGIARLEKAKLEIFDAGHVAHLERPEEFERSLTRFLSDVAAARPDWADT